MDKAHVEEMYNTLQDVYDNSFSEFEEQKAYYLQVVGILQQYLTLRVITRSQASIYEKPIEHAIRSLSLLCT